MKLSILLAVAILAGVTAAGSDFGNSGPGIRDQHLVSGYMCIMESPLCMHVYIRSYKPVAKTLGGEYSAFLSLAMY